MFIKILPKRTRKTLFNIQLETNDVIHNLTFLKPKFAVKRCVQKTKVTKFSNSSSSLQK
jgi:hypothetical protein